MAVSPPRHVGFKVLSPITGHPVFGLGSITNNFYVCRSHATLAAGLIELDTPAM